MSKVLSVCALLQLWESLTFPQDSGISQLSTGAPDNRGLDVTDDKTLEETNGVLSGRSSSVSSPTHRQFLSDSSRNGLDTLTDDDMGKGTLFLLLLFYHFNVNVSAQK